MRMPSITDYFGKLNGALHFVNLTEVEDEFGGSIYSLNIGNTFDGVAIQTRTQQYVMAQQRGVIDEAYTVVVGKDTNLNSNDIIMIEASNGRPRTFLKIDTFPAINPPNSNFIKWKYYNASVFKPEHSIIE